MSKELDEAIDQLCHRIAGMIGRAAYNGGGPSFHDEKDLAERIKDVVREAIIDARTEEL